MIKAIKIIYWLFVLWAAVVVLLDLNANVTFGHGLGDVYYLLFIVFCVIIISVFNFKLTQNAGIQLANVLLLISILVVVIAVTLKLTIYRGSEYPWNGRLFLNG